MKLKPLADRVIVRPIEDQGQKMGGIIIPDTAKEKPVQGEIVAVGPGKLNDDGKKVPLEVKIGDRILYGKYTGTEVEIDEQELLVMKESERMKSGNTSWAMYHTRVRICNCLNRIIAHVLQGWCSKRRNQEKRLSQQSELSRKSSVVKLRYESPSCGTCLVDPALTSAEM
jgi:chaperonin GroES